MQNKIIKKLKELVEEKEKHLEFLLLNSTTIPKEEIKTELKETREIYESLQKGEKKEKQGEWYGCCYENEVDNFIGKHYA